MNERVDWYLPLVGGAEMNRLLNKPLVNILYTSRPYPIIEVDGIGVVGGDVRGLPTYVWAEAVGVGAAVVAADATGTIYTEYRYPPEAIQISSSVTSGTATGTIFTTYRIPDPDAIGVSASVLSGSAQVQLIVYRNYEPEAISVSASVTAAGAT